MTMMESLKIPYSNNGQSYFLPSMDKYNRGARVTLEATQQMIQAAGFTNFKQDVTLGLSLLMYLRQWRRR
jgi:hypothetical protein